MDTTRILTGDRPTGRMHLGHYFGTLENRVKLQNEGNDVFIIIADYQVLTDRLETSDIESNIIELTKDYLSAGIDPSVSTIFVQSQIPELSELTLLFSMLVSVSRVSRNPTVKEEIKAMKLENNVSMGMFSYPVSQAADILLFNANLVPVGEDQLPHIELTREIARKFNRQYGEVFTIPKPMLSQISRLVGLDGNDKMSKSRNNAIFLSDTESVIMKKIKSAVTDSGSEIVYDPKNKPNISNLLTLFSLVSGKSVENIAEKYRESGYGFFKQSLGQAIVEFLKPFQKRRTTYSDSEIQDILTEGNKKARLEGEALILEVKKRMKMRYPF